MDEDVKVEGESIVPAIGDLLGNKKTRYFRNKPVIFAIAAIILVAAALLAASQKIRPTIARSGDVPEKYRAAKPSYELISPRGDQWKPYAPPAEGVPDSSVIPAAPSSSFFAYDDDAAAAPDYTVYPQPAPLPALGGENKLVYDAAAQATAESRQLKMEMIRSSYSAKPNVEGDWPHVEIRQLSQAQYAETGPAPTLPEVKSPAERMLEYQKKAVEAGLVARDGSRKLSAKEEFFASAGSAKGYLKSTREAPISPYTVPSGTMIPCALISGINSDLPGNITAVVTENVYDWAKPHVCLIPQGSRVFGEYDANIAFAQKRIQVKWTRLIYPDGSVIKLDGMPGVDRCGYTGLRGKFYGHYGRMITAAVLTTGFGLLPEWIEDRHKKNDSGTVISSGGQTIVLPPDNDDFRHSASSRVAETVGSIGNKIFDKSLNVEPTIIIRPGTRFNIQADADIPFYRAW